MNDARRLILVRHAKAEPYAATDHARELTERGRREAAAAATYLRERSVVPDHVVVSPAVRARATWEAIEQVIVSGADVTYDDSVYSGSTDVLLEALRCVPGDADVVVLVGHQPSIGYLAHLLDGGDGEPDALQSMLHGFPAASLAVFEVDGAWADLGPETGRLVEFRAGQS